MNSFISTKQAAKNLNVSVRRIQALIAEGRLPAQKIGNSFAIDEADLRRLVVRKNGRPANGDRGGEENWDTILDEIIGCADDLPSDLSSNPSYMEGFGREK